MKERIQNILAVWAVIVAVQTMAISCSDGSANAWKYIDSKWITEAQNLWKMSFSSVSPHNSTQCQQDISQMFQNIQVLDAFGKPGAGLLEGNTAWLGNYEECRSQQEQGYDYCLAYMQINTTVLLPKGTVFLIRWGICPPASCSEEDIFIAIEYFLSVYTKQYAELKAVSAKGVVCDKSPPIPYSAGVICTIVLLSILGLLMILGSLFDEYLKFRAKRGSRSEQHWLYCSLQNDEAGLEDDSDDDDELLLGEDASNRWRISYPQQQPEGGILGKFVLCFAATRNLSKLLNLQQKDTSIGSLNGIRVISMSWVILGHALYFSIIYGTSQNGAVLGEWLGNFGFQVLTNAFFAVDSFFFLSGCLISYLTLSRMDDLKSVKAWLWFYFHRYWRLTPLLGLTILVWMYIHPFFGDGPVWQSTVGKPQCENYWWTNFLYINNFYPQGFGSQCIGWTWYLANDMQFFIISPLLIVPLYYFPVFGLVALSAVTIVCMIATASVLIAYNASVDILSIVEAAAGSGYGLDFNSLVYEKPYSRIAPYLVGIGLGYILHRIDKRRVKMSPLIAIVGWLLAAAIAMSVVYGFYPSYHSAVPLTRAGQVVYGTLSRFAWGVAMAWVVFACKYGYGGWINGFLSWPGWIPLSRITYSVYMFHPIVFAVFYANFGTSIYLSRYLLAYFFAGNLLLSYFIALFVSLAVEYPLANLEKFFMPNNPKEKHERQNITSSS